MVHVVGLKIARFYKAYVEDADGTMTEEQAEEIAKKMFEDNGLGDIHEDEEMDVEADDLIEVEALYDIDD